MTTQGKYTLVRKLAVGGMAEVFLARTRGPAGFSKTLVIKRILPDLVDNAEFVSMFLNEARLAALLNHPNIIQIFELGSEGGTYYLVMELVEGAHLRGLIRAARARGEYLPLNEVLKIISLACEGLAYAHELADDRGRPLQLVHRDVSPENLLISRQGAVKVADFGIAKAANLPHLTRTGILKGKISYMSPEQLEARALDKRADVFSLGVALHEALTLARPFDGGGEVATMRAILAERSPRLTELRPDLPVEVQAVVDRALEKDRERRYPDCRALLADLDRLLLKRQAMVGAGDLAELVNRYLPPDPPAGAGPDEVAIEISLGDVLESALAPRPAPPALASSPPPPAPEEVIELRGGRPSEVSRRRTEAKRRMILTVAGAIAGFLGVVAVHYFNLLPSTRLPEAGGYGREATDAGAPTQR
jgi:serine/threonine protein kinase